MVTAHLASLLLATQPAHGRCMLLSLDQRLQELFVACSCLQLCHHLPAQRISLRADALQSSQHGISASPGLS